MSRRAPAAMPAIAPAVTPPVRERSHYRFAAGAPVACPHGHRIARALPLPGSHTIVRCHCLAVAWVWIYCHEDDAHTVVWLRPVEMRAIRRHRWSAAAVCRALGLPWPLPNDPAEARCA